MEVVNTRLCNSIVNQTHGLNDLFLDLGCAFDVEVGQEMVSYGNQSVLRPALEPVHGTPRDQTRELQGSSSELLSNLERKDIYQ